MLTIGCGVATAGDALVGYSWRLSSADGRVDKTQPEAFESVPLGLFGPVGSVARSDFVDLLAPAQTSADISLRGRVNFLARSLGVAVSAAAKVNPYDPQSPTLDPILISAEAAVQAGFVDRVFVFDPTVAPGAPISFQVQPLRTIGRMDVVPESPNGGGGSAIFQINFLMENVAGSSQPPASLNFEQIVMSGIPAESTWNATALGGLATLAGGPITVPNASVWDVVFFVRAAVQALPGMLPASNPRGALSEANFINTVHWGGLHDIVDGQGRSLANFTMQSELGFDWVSSVPEPGHALLLLVGLGVVALRRRWT